MTTSKSLEGCLTLALIFLFCRQGYGNVQPGNDEAVGALLKRLVGGSADLKMFNKRRADSRVSFKECNLPEATRLDCGDYGLDEEGCYARECCWGESKEEGVPWCYHSKPTMMPGCLMNTDERNECGFYGIRKEQCLAQGCCWQPSSHEGAPWCFHTKRMPVYEGECGVPSISPFTRSRIVGGTEAVPHSWPWMVSLQDGSGHFCGGSLINNQWVMTAAHCAPAFYYGNTQEVVLGMHSQTSTDESSIRVKVAEIIEHENFGTSGLNNDIMLLKLEVPVEFSENVSPVCLPDAGEAFNDGRRCYTTGWGNTEFWGSSPDKLQQVMVPLINRELCNGEDWYGGDIDVSMICAGYTEGGRDSCQGDSGGPLVCFKDEKWVLVGIVSWGEGCAFEQKPGVYSKVSHLVRWAERKVSENQ